MCENQHKTNNNNSENNNTVQHQYSIPATSKNPKFNILEKRIS